jgi:hypothetical protein
VETNGRTLLDAVKAVAARAEQAEQERDRLRTFAREVLDGYRTGVVGDVDGGWLQDRALELGLLVSSDSEDDGNFYLCAALSPQDTQRQEPTE